MDNNFYESVYLDTYNSNPIGDSYYLVSIKPFSHNVTYASFYSIWDNESTEQGEKRKIGLIDPEKAIDTFKKESQGLSIIETAANLRSFLIIGGHALIAENIAASGWKEILVSRYVLKQSSIGYIEYDTIGVTYGQRFARGELRGEIFNRDNCQCKICGSSPDDSIHVRLEAHHIKPWEEGGLTEINNLITLCKGCHDGIKAIDRRHLYKKIGVRFPDQNHLIYEMPKSFFFRPIILNSVTLKISKKKLQNVVDKLPHPEV